MPNSRLGRIHINNLGFRGPDVEAAKTPDTIRFLFLGSSTTYDAYSAEGENWPHRTLTLLQEYYSNCRLDFVNAGLPGYGTDSILKLYEAKLAELGADVIILLPGDINQDLDWLASRQGFDATHYERSLLAELSVLWAKIEMNLRIIELQRAAFNRTDKVILDLDLLKERFRTRLAMLIDRINKDEPLVLISEIGSQLRNQLSQAEQVRAANTSLFFMPNVALQDVLATRLVYNDIIREVASSKRATVIQSIHAPPPNRTYYKDTTHFTPQGSRAMAAALAEELVSIPDFRTLIDSKKCGP
jgi:lysophospholipase L1-like esterase